METQAGVDCAIREFDEKIDKQMDAAQKRGEDADARAAALDRVIAAKKD
jgi:hypothetical protein